MNISQLKLRSEEFDDDDDDDDNDDNNNNKLKAKFGSIARKTFDRFTTKDSYTWNITHNTESTAVRITVGSREVLGRKAVASDDNNHKNNYNNILIVAVLLFLMQMSVFPFCCYITNLIILEPG